MKKNFIYSYVPMFVIAVALIGRAEVKSERKTLAGLTAVTVAIDLTDDSRAAGITEQQLQTDVELRLRKAGIKVLDVNTLANGCAFVAVQVTVVSTKDGMVAYSIAMQLRQLVRPTRANNNDITMASTWGVSMVGLVGKNNAANGIKEDVLAKTDQFINAYLAANQK